MAEIESGNVSKYSPLYAERRCLVCGYWRGQHLGASVNDNEMRCPVEVTPSFDLGRVQQCFESVCDARRKRAAHPGADGYVLCELIPVSLEKPAWPGLEQPVSSLDRRLAERLPVIDLDIERRITA